MEKKYLTYPYKPILLTADNNECLEEQYNELCNEPKSNIGNSPLYDVIHGDKDGLYRKVIVFNEESKEFERIIEQSEPCSIKRPIVFMCAGIGNQYKNMAYGLYRNIKYFRDLFDECSILLQQIINCDIRELVFDEHKYLEDIRNRNDSQTGTNLGFLKSVNQESDLEKRDPIYQTKYSHAILFSIEYCLAKTLIYMGIVPDALIGHSVGEYVAVALSEAMNLKDVLALIAKRALLFDKLQPGYMMTVLADDIAIRKLMQDVNGIFLAAENSPISYTISGMEDAISNAEKYCEKEDLLSFRVPAERAFHSEYMRPMGGEFINIFDGIKMNEPQIPVISNVTGDWMTIQQISNPESWLQHTCSTVHFSSGIKKLINNQNPILVEIGPGQLLTGFVYQHRFDDGKKITAVSSLRDGKMNISDSLNLLILLSKLWVNGSDVKWELFMDT